MTGSLRIQEIVLAQAGWPWDWLAFRSPAALASVALLLTCAPAPARRPAGASLPVGLSAMADCWVDAADEGSTPSHGFGAFDAMRRAHCVVVAGLASVLFLGGWLLPGLPAGNEGARPVLEVAGAAWLLVKTWGLVAVVTWSRRVLPRRTRRRKMATPLLLVPALLAVALASLAATAAWTCWSPQWAVQRLVSVSLATAVALVAAALVHRLRHGLSWSVGEGRLSPFL
jgi:NADH-quinone oxidoreductase subunit H